MKKIISGFLLISILTVLLTACDSNVENFQTSQEVQTTEATITQTTTVQAATATTREAAEQTTQSEQNPQYTNGELTQKLGKELNELFDGDIYYFKEVTDSFQDDSSNLQVSVTIKDGNNYCSIQNNNSVAGELKAGDRGLIGLEDSLYCIEDTLKQVHRIKGKSVILNVAESTYPRILPPIVKYNSTSIVEEDGIQLNCETYDDSDENGKLNYYYDGEKLKRFEFLLLDGTIIWSKTIEYSKEIDKSLFELPNDYEIVDVDDGL